MNNAAKVSIVILALLFAVAVCAQIFLIPSTVVAELVSTNSFRIC